MPDMAMLMQNITKLPQGLDLEGFQKYIDALPMCAKPTKVNECHMPGQDIQLFDSCQTTKLVMGLTIPVVNFTINVTMNMMNCTISQLCTPSAIKSACDTLKGAMTVPGLLNLDDCKISCCKEDLCNVAEGSDKPTAAGATTAADANTTAPGTTVAGPTNKGSREGCQFGAIFTLAAAVVFRALF